MVARVLFPWLTILEEHDPIPTGGRPSRPSHPLIHHPRPYGSPGFLPDFPTEIDAYWTTARVVPTIDNLPSTVHPMRCIVPCIVGTTLAVVLGRGRDATYLTLARMGARASAPEQLFPHNILREEA